MPKQTNKQIAQSIKDMCESLGWGFNVRSNMSVLTIYKRFTVDSRDEFVQADGEYYSILELLPTSSSGTVWGTDGSGMGAISALRSGVFTMNKSGGNKNVLRALTKL